MCDYPKLIKNKRYLPTEKNNYNPPKCDDERKLYVPVSCGICRACMKKKASAWKVRLIEDIKGEKNIQFVTLTFSEESLKKLEKELKANEANSIATIAVRRFLERWRKKYKVSVKHWLVTELGHQNTERIHLHGIIYTDKKEEIKKIWQYGIVHIGEYVNEKTISYIIKYVTKTDFEHKGYVPKIMTSPGIGRKYISTSRAEQNKYKEKDTDQKYRTNQGNKVALPEYYRRKIYSEEERDNLWTELLDKNERWVNGYKIDISTEDGDKEYYKALEIAQKKSEALGYSNPKTWKKKDYAASRTLIDKKEIIKKYNKKNLENKKKEIIFAKETIDNFNENKTFENIKTGFEL